MDNLYLKSPQEQQDIFSLVETYSTEEDYRMLNFLRINKKDYLHYLPIIWLTKKTWKQRHKGKKKLKEKVKNFWTAKKDASLTPKGSNNICPVTSISNNKSYQLICPISKQKNNTNTSSHICKPQASDLNMETIFTNTENSKLMPPTPAITLNTSLK